MTMADGRGAAYWTARAHALEAANLRLRKRLLALAAVLPPEYLDDLDPDSPAGEARRPMPPFLSAGEEGPHLTPAEVEPEIRSLWARTALPEDG